MLRPYKFAALVSLFSFNHSLGVVYLRPALEIAVSARANPSRSHRAGAALVVEHYSARSVLRPM